MRPWLSRAQECLAATVATDLVVPNGRRRRAWVLLARLHTVSRRGLRRVRVPFDGARRVGRSTVLGGSAVFEAANALLAKIRS